MRVMRSFSQVIDDLELKDLPLHGGDFTWAGQLGDRGIREWLGWIDS